MEDRCPFPSPPRYVCAEEYIILIKLSKVTHIVAHQNDSNAPEVKRALQMKIIIITEAFLTDSVANGRLCDSANYNPFASQQSDQPTKREQTNQEIKEKETEKKDKGKEKEKETDIEDYDHERERREIKGKEKEEIQSSPSPSQPAVVMERMPIPARFAKAKSDPSMLVPIPRTRTTTLSPTLANKSCAEIAKIRKKSQSLSNFNSTDFSTLALASGYFRLTQHLHRCRSGLSCLGVPREG